MKDVSIAIYSGEIPSTSFIENLIDGLSKRGYNIYLFGQSKKQVNYASNIQVFYFKKTYLGKVFYILSSVMFLFLFKNRDFRILYKKAEVFKKGRFYQTISHLSKALMVIRNKPHVFHVQWIKTAEDWVFLKSFNIKLVGSFRGAHINYSPLADDYLASSYKRAFPAFDAFHAVSTAISNEATKYGATESKIYRIPGAVHPSLLCQETDLKPLNFQRKIKILSIGREHWKKGYHYALDACQILKDNNIPFEYTIVGIKGDEEILFQYHDLGLENEVKLLNNIPYHEVRDYYIHSDIFLLPSVEEGIANVVLEAMACGTTVICANCGGMAEVIQHEVNGFLVAVRRPDLIASCIQQIFNGEFDLHQIRTNALQTIKRSHLIPDQLNNFELFYQKILQ